ncbi:MAG TPA: hypothetical protein VF282_05360 [Bacillota bacterium]
MRRWFVLGLVVVALTACRAAPPAADTLPATVQYRVEGPGVSLQVQDVLNPTPSAEIGDYWLVRQDPVTIQVDLPFRPTASERARLEARIRQSLPAAGIRHLTWDGHQVCIDLDLPPGTHGLALGGIVNFARWIGQGRLWVKHETSLIVDATNGTAELVSAADVVVHPDGRRALFEVAREDGDAWPWTWHWRLAVRSAAGEVMSRWDLFSAESLEVVPRLHAWWGPDGILFTQYTTGGGQVLWRLAAVDPDTGDVWTLAGPATYIAGLSGGQYLLVGGVDDDPGDRGHQEPADTDATRWQIWRSGAGLTDLTLPAELERRVPARGVHSLWGEWMVLYAEYAADPYDARPMLWRVNSDQWLELRPVRPLGWYEGTFYWLREQGGEP